MTENILQALGLPPAFGATLLGFGLILALAPYLAGTDFGLFKVPAFSARGVKRLRVLGPLALAAAIALHVPLLSLHTTIPNASGTSAIAGDPAGAPTKPSEGARSNEPTTPPPPNRKDLAPLTMSTTVYPNEKCQPNSDFDIRTMSTINVGMNNQSDRDIVLTSVELVPEWVTGDLWFGVTHVSKNYTVILDDWWDLAIAAHTSDDLLQHAQSVGGIRKARDWYFSHRNIFWVKPKPISVKEIPADVFTVKQRDQERFQISLGLSDSNHFLYGTAKLVVTTDDGKQLKSESIKFSICIPDSSNE